ncbi:NACHT domain-containing protein, partial [Bradyrhizobium sp. 24]|nr:NACHT domain-containing protein [Bradyrhizobium sp. 24]
MTIAGELIFKVVGSFASDGLKKTYQEVRGGIRRRQTVDKVLSDELGSGDDRLKRAMNDLHIVIGNSRGQLNETMAAFLREVERSAIPEALIKSILTNIEPDKFFPAFDLIYQPFKDQLPFTSEKFFKAFYTAVKLSVEAEVKDPALLEFVQAQNSELARQLADMSKALEASKLLLDPPNLKEIFEGRTRLARSLEVANRYLSVETVKGVKRCRIRQLVVPPRLSTSKKVEVKKANSQPRDSDYISYVTFKSSVRRAVILGDPGGGKSTLTQLLSFDNSNSILLESNYPGKTEPSALKLPLRIVLRSFDKRRQSTPGYSLLDHLVDQAKDVFDGDVDYTSRMLRHFMALGSALLIFDGLDEILEVDRRRETVSLIEQFTTVYAACPSIVTSRLVGYEDAPMNEDFSFYYLSTFNNEEVEIFAQKFIKFVEGLKKPEAKEKSKKFLSQTNNIAADLRENPLMLGLMVYLFVYKGDVPANRPEIYKECATLMFEKWDQRRDIIFKIPVDFELLDLFAFLASKIFGSAQTDDGVSREWITNQLRIFFEDWYVDKAKALQAAKALVEFITGRAWVMFEVGPNVYKFTHRTFLEYFFARHLLSSSQSVDQLFRDKLLAHVVKLEWDVVCHLALQTAVYRDSGKIIQATETIVSLIKGPNLSDKEELGLLAFVATALDYLILPEIRYRDLVRLIVSRTTGLGTHTGAAPYGVITSAIRSSKRREALAKDVIYSSIQQAIRSSDLAEHYVAMLAIAKDSMPRLVPHHRARSISPGSPLPAWVGARSNSEYFQELRDSTQGENFARAVKSASEARAYLFSYGQRHLELFHKHRWQAFYGSTEYSPLIEMPNLFLETLCFYVNSDPAIPLWRRSAPHGSNSDENWELIRLLAEDVLA